MATVHEHPLRATILTLASMPAFLESTLARVPRGRWAERPAAGSFSLVEQACHLRDVEREGYLVRVRRILEEEMPRLAGFDGAAVARERDYGTQDAKLAAGQFASARADLARLMLGHDREHREEMAALVDALGG